jgi:hypothetical protein
MAAIMNRLLRPRCLAYDARFSLRVTAFAGLAAVALGLLVGTCLGAPGAEDPRWHFAEATQRWLLTVTTPAQSETITRPVRIPTDGLKLDHGTFRAWDLEADREVPVQALGAELLVDPVAGLPGGAKRRYLLYQGPDAAATASVARRRDQVVETDRYQATIDRSRGGILGSLVLKEGSRRIETLGDGLTWWIGRQNAVRPEKFAGLPVEQTGQGPVFLGLRVEYKGVLDPANSLRVDYRFFRDFVEVDYHYTAAKPVDLTWLKIPVSLRTTGTAAGSYSNSRQHDTAMQTTGAKNQWINDRLWHDVSYTGPKGFGLGVIARHADGGLYYMDSVQAKEHEWIYAEPFSWNTTKRIEQDFDVQLTLVPHAPGPERWKETVAKLEQRVSGMLSSVQGRGQPAIDSDRDGLPDLVEFQRGTNPQCADTDADGQPDGSDSAPLRGAVPSGQLAMPSFQAAPTTQAQTIAEVKPVLGVPTIVLDGKPYGPMTYTRCAGTLDQIAQIADCGVRVHFEMVGGVGWPGQQQDVFRRLDDQVGKFLEKVPNARMILRLYVCAPPGFVRNYPDEVLRFSDGAIDHFEKWYAVKHLPPEDRGYPSFASTVWREKTAEALAQYVTHVRQSPYAKNIIGYFVCGGGTEEWYYWGDYNNGRYALDYSPPMLRALRDYLRRKYQGDVARLREAWHDSQVDFGTALPPEASLRRQGATGVFWDESLRQRMQDYYYVHNKVMEDSLLIFARAVKQACARQQLVGMFHGYLQNHWLLEGGQATLKDLLASPDVDFWSGPPQYDRRGQGEHACNRFLLASFKQHGKLWISESDIRTNFSEFSPHNPSLYGRAPGLEESLACLKREFAHQLCEGGNGWWFQMGRQWYHHPPILSLFSRMQQIGEAAMAADRTSDTDIAAVVDLDSMLVSPPWPVMAPLLDAFKVQETCRIGAPVDHYELDDILADNAKPYKLYLMINCFRLTDQERQRIDQRLRRRGAVLVWMFAPGLFDPDRTSERDVSHCEQLLGFRLESTIAQATAPTMRLTDAGAAQWPTFDRQRQFGSFERPRWQFDPKTGQAVQKPAAETKLPERFFGPEGAEVLARFVDNQRPAIVQRRTQRATDIWIGSVMAPADLLRAIARRAGCHLYCDADEIVYANKSFLAIHTATSGTRTFHLRRPADVIEVFSGQVVAKNVAEFTDSIDAFRTRLYYVGSQPQWDAQSRRADETLSQFRQELQSLRAAKAKPSGK